MLLRFRNALRRPLPHLVAALNVFVVRGEDLGRLPYDPPSAGAVCDRRNLRGDASHDRTLNGEDVGELRPVRPGKQMSLSPGLDQRIHRRSVQGGARGDGALARQYRRETGCDASDSSQGFRPGVHAARVAMVMDLLSSAFHLLYSDLRAFPGGRGSVRIPLPPPAFAGLRISALSSAS